MVVLPLVLILLGGILFAWMLYKATVYALPFLAGLGGATVAYRSNAGLEGAALVGLLVATATFVSLRFILARVPNGPVRLMIAFILVLPSLILGYNIGVGVLEGMVPSALWRHVISVGYALLGGWLAFVRLTEFKD
jgi:hypothetical protein